MSTGRCAGCGHRKKLFGDRCVGCLRAGAHGDTRPGRQATPWAVVGGGRVNARPNDPMREAQEQAAFDQHLESLPKLPCGCSVGTRCSGAHAQRPARHGRSHGNSAKLSVADAHQLRILKDTVRNPLKGQFLGGPSAAEAEETLRSKFRFTSEQIRQLKGDARRGDMSSRGRSAPPSSGFESWRGGIELALVRWMERVHKTPYWVARDAALDVVKKAKGLRQLHRQGLSSSQAAARLAAELPQ